MLSHSVTACTTCTIRIILIYYNLSLSFVTLVTIPIGNSNIVVNKLIAEIWEHEHAKEVKQGNCCYWSLFVMIFNWILFH